MEKSAPIVVDYQHGFAEEGTLAVSGAHGLASVIQSQIHLTRNTSGLIIATPDWHPEKTIHFKCDGGSAWTVCCLAGTPGAKYVDGIYTRMIDIEMYKGFKNSDDGYSGFEGVDSLSGDPVSGFHLPLGAHNLEQVLRNSSIQVLIITGLAKIELSAELIKSCMAAFNARGFPNGEERIQELLDIGVNIVE